MKLIYFLANVGILGSMKPTGCLGGVFNDAWEDLKDEADAACGDACDTIAAPVDTIGNEVGNAVDTIGNEVGNAVDTIKDQWGNVVDAIGDLGDVFGVDCFNFDLGLDLDINPCDVCEGGSYGPDPFCQQQDVCRAYASPFTLYKQGVEGTCEGSMVLDRMRDMIEDATQLLIDHGIFGPEVFDGVHIRFCDTIGKFAGGFAASQKDVLISFDYLSYPLNDLAELLAHEMIHIEQYRRWGHFGFDCRYWRELKSGKGYKRGNFVEDEAYDFEGRVHHRLTGEPVAIQTHSGKFVTAMNGGGGDVVAAAIHVKEWETFRKIDEYADGKFALQTSNLHYLQAYGGGDDVINALPDKANSWELFSINNLEDGKVQLLTDSMNLVYAENGGGGILDSSTVFSIAGTNYEEFRLLRQIAIQTSNGNFVSATEKGGVGNDVVATATKALEWETFWMIPLGGCKYAFQTLNAHYLQATFEDIIAEATSIGEWETFIVQRSADNNYLLQSSYSGLYVSALEGGGGELQANREEIGPWEEFNFVYVHDGKTAELSLGEDCVPDDEPPTDLPTWEPTDSPTWEPYVEPPFYNTPTFTGEVYEPPIDPPTFTEEVWAPTWEPVDPPIYSPGVDGDCPLLCYENGERISLWTEGAEGWLQCTDTEEYGLSCSDDISATVDSCFTVDMSDCTVQGGFEWWYWPDDISGLYIVEC